MNWNVHEPHAAEHSDAETAHAHCGHHVERHQVEQEILAKNDQYAARNRAWLNERDILAINLVASPGAGKTTLLTATIRASGDEFPCAVIEGDQETLNDAERIRETGAAAIQVNTGRGCHLDAHAVGHAIEALRPADGSVLFIENVGNLVCPAAFDLGEAVRVVVLSVTEGADKPSKYPDMFAAADVLVISKTDLCPYVDFDIDDCIAQARELNPHLLVHQVSAQSGAGIRDWIAWLKTVRTQLQGAPGPAMEPALIASRRLHGHDPQA
jgi:hydrogenase nickel incorporation protein HypB